MYSLLNAAFSIERVVLVLLISLFAFGCGGGGGGGGDNSPDSSDSSSDNSDGTPIVSESDHRVLRRRYDFDNNGVFEGVSDFIYDPSGRVQEERYIYTDDGTPDVTIEGSTYPRGRSNTTATYTYDSSGRLETWTEISSEYSFSTTYTYNANDLISRADTDVLDSTGGVTSEIHHLLEYDDMKLVSHTLRYNSNSTTDQTFILEYDSNGRVDTNHMTPATSSGASLSTYAYYTDGMLESATETYPGMPSLGESVLSYTYNSNNQPATFEFRSDLTDYVDNFSYTYQYDNDGRLFESQIDRYLDSSTDAVIQTEWEQGVCTPMITWEPKAIAGTMADPSSPYLPGTGYWVSDYCDTTTE